ncbi:hypothetical protein [Streptomyces sp. x-19]|uniref:hypothetical protein n=1 Tax=Streptomyces sp. x-19 TaxID=2789280 RepID=UPI00397F1559
MHGIVISNSNQLLTNSHSDMAMPQAEIVGPVAPHSGEVINRRARQGRVAGPVREAGNPYHPDVLYKVSKDAKLGSFLPLNLAVFGDNGVELTKSACTPPWSRRRSNRPENRRVGMHHPQS